MHNNDYIVLSPEYRVLENDESVIIGNIVNGKWFKCKKEAYEFLIECINKNMRYEEMLNKCEDQYTKDYIVKFITLLVEIDVIEKSNSNINQCVIEAASIILTNGCNLRCRHCVSNCGGLERKDLSFDTIKKVIDWCESKSIKEITLTGGEIFIRSDIKEILKYVRQNYSGKIVVITNATLITDNILDTVVKNVGQIDISLDGYDEESVAKIRGNGVFKKVTDVIEQLHKHNFTKISLSMVLTGENRKHVEDFKNLCKTYEVNELLRVLSPRGRAAENFEELVDINFDKGSNNISEYSFKCVCKKLNSELSIDENGNIYPCVLLQKDGFQIGNVKDMDKGLKLIECNDPLIDSIEKCKDCNIRYFCASNCLGHDMSVFYNEMAKSVRCKKAKEVYSVVWD